MLVDPPARIAAAVVGFGLWWLASGSAASEVAMRRWLPGLGPLGMAFARASFSAAMLIAIALWGLTLPDRSVYALGAPWRWALQVGQIAGLTLIAASARAALRLDVEPSAPGTDVSAEEAGRPALPWRATGPYAHVRHPVASGVLATLWLTPQMTVNRAAFNAALTAVLLVGTAIEDRRRAARFGATYATYRDAVPRLIPRPGGATKPDSAPFADP